MIDVNEKLRAVTNKNPIVYNNMVEFLEGENYDYPIYEVFGKIIHNFQNELYDKISDFILYYCLDSIGKKQITEKQYKAIVELCSRCDPRDTQEYFYEKTEEILNGDAEND